MNKSDKIKMVMNYMINIRSFSSSISKEVKEDFSKSDINCSEAFYIVLLNSNQEGLTMSELSSLAKVDKSLTTRIIKKLLDKEYIYKDTDDLSSRNYKIKLTNSGINKANNISDVLVNKYDNFTQKFTDEEIEMMTRAFNLLLTNFE